MAAGNSLSNITYGDTIAFDGLLSPYVQLFHVTHMKMLLDGIPCIVFKEN